MSSAATSYRLTGLKGPVRIDVDRWGIPHINAESMEDLFYAQGFNAARDRLWQIDLWRKRGLGLLSRDFGPGYLHQDKAARLFLYRGEMQAEWSHYGPHAEQICSAFASGINAYIELVDAGDAPLPLEFRVLGTAPAVWHAEDVVRIRSHSLCRNAASEVARSILTETSDLAEFLRCKPQPEVDYERDPNPLLKNIPRAVVDLLNLATAPVTFSRERLSATLEEADRWRTMAQISMASSERPDGSNNWAVSAARSETGRPILASDPHRSITVPSLRYLVHLKAPGWNVIGAGEPNSPGICIGHNETSAFGLTILRADQEDLYVYETDGASRYLDAAQWADFQTIEEAIPVKGCADQIAVLRFSRHGPVVFDEPSSRRAFAIRSVWFEPGTAPYMASLRTMRAGSLADFTAALDGWGAPSVNQVYADVTGTIARLPAGHVPYRPNWRGLMPVPGDGRFEWRGRMALHRMAAEVDPLCGFVLSANEMNLPADWDHRTHPVGFEWDERSRSRRIAEVLGQDPPHSLTASCRLQTDVMSLVARRVLPVLRRLHTEEDRYDLGLLQEWDGKVAAESGPGAFFEIWWTRFLKPMVIARFVPAHLGDLVSPGDNEAVLEVLEQPGRFFVDGRPERFDELILASLDAAFRKCRKLMGSDAKDWSWGGLHRAEIEHALSNLAGEEGPQLNVGPLPVGGDSSTVMHMDFDSIFRVTTAASIRLVMDVGNWDDSLCINMPGQAGDPFSPHYKDFAPLWAEGAYVPLLYSAERIAEETSFTIVLEPLDSNKRHP
ncbi:penicillin amidase [Rhodoligotrophos appendicifer]|uniref:penicillin acylase family protein n=1 Tax=Rhodoligotrophos appendicifer TaxID=987056 RepID=UPI00118608CC|nr:penicillin acylase family protein [Rhodoligotrophos appendicifer]